MVAKRRMFDEVYFGQLARRSGFHEEKSGETAGSSHWRLLSSLKFALLSMHDNDNRQLPLRETRITR